MGVTQKAYTQGRLLITGRRARLDKELKNDHHLPVQLTLLQKKQHWQEGGGDSQKNTPFYVTHGVFIVTEKIYMPAKLGLVAKAEKLTILIVNQPMQFSRDNSHAPFCSSFHSKLRPKLLYDVITEQGRCMPWRSTSQSAES